MSDYKHKQGDRVYFSMGGEKAPTGWAKVCGVVGPILIVELEKPIDNYPFTHTYIMDIQVVDPPTL